MLIEKQNEHATVEAEEVNTDQERVEEPQPVMEEVIDATALQEELHATKEALEKAESRTLRLQADYENFKRRTRLDQEAQVTYRAQQLVTELLPVLDNFERALQTEPTQDETKTLLSGVEMVCKSFIGALEKEGVQVVEAVGQPFDPNVHQSVLQDWDESHPEDVVLEELQKGYKLKERLLRPAMVKVNSK